MLLGRRSPVVFGVCSILLSIQPACQLRSASQSDESALPRDSRDPPPASLQTFLKDKETRATPGLFVTYAYRQKTYLLVQKKQLGKPFLLTGLVSQGAGMSAGTPLGQPTGTGLLEEVVTFVRQGNRLFLIQKPHRHLTSETMKQAVEQTFSPFVMASLPIVAEDKPSGRSSGKASGDLLLAVDDLLLEDLAAAGMAGRDAIKPSRRLSYVEASSGTAVSTSLRVRLGYSTSLYTDLGHPVNSVRVTYSFLDLPETPLLRREADDRIGTFAQPFRDFDSASPRLTAHAVMRWRLEPDHKEGPLLVPKRPIVFYLDPATPKSYQPYILDGVRQWNRAFEAAGWKDAVRASLLPTGVSIDDPRAAVIHWDVGEPSFNGRGQPLVDPRSGEILGASLILSMGPVRTHLRLRKTVLAPQTENQQSRSDHATINGSLLADESDLADSLSEQAEVLRAALLSTDAVQSDGPLPEALIGQRLRLLAMHEAGHALGLRHNFRASSIAPSDQLGNPDWQRQSPLVSSVMDYPAINLPPSGSPAAKRGFDPSFLYYPTSLGPSDLLSIAYAYTPDPGYAAQLAKQAAAWGYVFGSDQEASLGADPLVQRWDLGSDPLAWAKDRSELLRKLWVDTMKTRLKKGERPAEITEQLGWLLADYARAVDAAPTYIGGRHSSRDHIGDPGGRPAYRPVEKAKQTEALAFLLDAVFSEQALPISAELAQQMGDDYLDFRRRDARNQTVYPLWRQVLDLRVSTLHDLLSPLRLRRMVDGEQVFGRDAVLTVGELLGKLSQSLFAEILSGTPSGLSPMRRELQLQYIESLGNLVLQHAPESRHARSQARYQLQELRGKLDALRSKRDSFDVDTRAHLAELEDSISATVNGAMVIRPPADSQTHSHSAE